MWAARARQKPQLIPREGPRSSKAAETTKEHRISRCYASRYGQRRDQQWTTNPTLTSNRGDELSNTLCGFDSRLPQASPCQILLRGSCVRLSLLNGHPPPQPRTCSACNVPPCRVSLCGDGSAHQKKPVTEQK